MPRVPPIIIRATDFQYSGRLKLGVRVGQRPAMTKAGMVNMAPAATDSPMEPTVRAMFSSSSEPFINRSNAIEMTAAG